MDALSEYLITNLEEHFGNKINNYVIENLVEVVSHHQFSVKFKAYNYFNVSFDYENGLCGFSIGSDKNFIRINLSTEWWNKIDMSKYLQELQDELELRIPDKYLIAKGWKTAEEDSLEKNKELVLDYMSKHHNMTEIKLKNAWEYLEQSYEVLNEFIQYIKTGDFISDDKAVTVEGYTAKQLYENTYLSPLGAFNYLIYLKKNPKEAIKNLKAGLPRK